MTAPRQRLAGKTYLVTRRCSERRFFLKPGSVTNTIFQFVLAVVSARYDVAVHAVCVLSNHIHLVVTDRHANLPEFHRDLDGLVARAMNCFLGRWESFWDPDSYSAVVLEDKNAILEKMVYLLANPVAAGLVRHASEWPGVWSAPSLIDGGVITLNRPADFFRKNGPLPPTATLRLCRPPGFENDDEFVATLTALLQEAEDRAAAELERDGRRFLGVARVLAQSAFSRPAAGEPRRVLSPRVATRNKWKRIEALQRLAEFVSGYKIALAAWRAGERNVLFPAGTWLMRWQHGAACCAYG
jgi:putative transposase